MQTLNLETVATFRDFMQADELRDFLDRVKRELLTDWPRLEGHWQAGEWTQVHKGAHRLKSVVGSVGCEALYEALHQLENDLRAVPPRLPVESDLARLRVTASQAELALAAAAVQAP